MKNLGENEMNIQIVGLGAVGTAQAYLAKELGHNVVGYDPQYDSHMYCKANDSLVGDVDITFICAPESEAPRVIENLVKIGHKGLIVIKSTVPVGTTALMSEKFGIHICHNPEFLREKTALEDVMNPSRIVIGECCPEHGDILRKFYEPINSYVHITDSTTSEIIKLVSNSFRAVTITFWNEIAILCSKKNIDIEKVSEICDSAKLIGEWEGGQWGTKYFLQPYDGKCLPKDIRHLISTFREIGENPKLFDACEEFNNKLKDKKTK